MRKTFLKIVEEKRSIENKIGKKHKIKSINNNNLIEKKWQKNIRIPKHLKRKKEDFLKIPRIERILTKTIINIGLKATKKETLYLYQLRKWGKLIKIK